MKKIYYVPEINVLQIVIENIISVSITDAPDDIEAF